MSTQSTAPDALRTFVVLAEHPTNGTRYDVELIASAPGRAISRVRGTMTHWHRDVAWLDGTFTILSEAPLPPSQ